MFHGIAVQEKDNAAMQMLFEQIYKSFNLVYAVLFSPKLYIKCSFPLRSNLLRDWHRLPNTRSYFDFIHKITIKLCVLNALM